MYFTTKSLIEAHRVYNSRLASYIKKPNNKKFRLLQKSVDELGQHLWFNRDTIIEALRKVENTS